MKRTLLLIAAAMSLAAGAIAADFNLLDLVGGEAVEMSASRSGRARKQRRAVTVERKASVAEKKVAVVANAVATNAVAASAVATNAVKLAVVKVAEKVVVVTNEVERIVPKVVEVERIVPKVVEKTLFVTNTVRSVVTNMVRSVVTNTVEKVVVDREREKRLARSNEDLAKRNAALVKENEELEKSGGRREVEYATLVESNDDLKRRLADSEDRNARLSRVVAPADLKQLSGRPAKISSQNTYYDRKEGFAVFTGRVHVDDEQYQMHAGKAYVFFDGTNQLKRLVAVGGVAITNGTKRAYGAKASYHRASGMVVLYSNDGTVAEVRDESKVQDQTVKGERIKFWIGAEQVEVMDARISAPAGGGFGDINKIKAR